jgi:hypothetical protein
MPTTIPICQPKISQEPKPFGLGGHISIKALALALSKKPTHRELAELAFFLDNSGRKPTSETLH